MKSLNDFAITKRWPPQIPDIIQLYSYPTPNGVKISIALEEMELAYEPHLVSLGSNDQLTPEFLSLNPNNKIPAIIDPNGPGGHPLPLWESGAILIYLAEKSGRLLPSDPVLRLQVLQWLMFQIGGVGPMFGQVGFFRKGPGKDYEDKRPLQRYLDEAARLLRVIDGQLTDQEWLVGDFTIADIAIGGWLRTLVEYYEVGHLVGWDDLKNVPGFLARYKQRPAVQRGLNIPAVS